MTKNIVVVTVKTKFVPGEQVFRLDKKRIVFGSASSSDVCLQHSSISSVHAILEITGIERKAMIYDLASETGVLVNGNPVVQATLTQTDILQMGPYFLEINQQKLSKIPTKQPFVKESDIFDRRSEAKNSLQVVMFYKDTILGVEHFVDKKKIVIGPGSKEDFVIPPFFGTGKEGRFKLVTCEGDKYYLHLHDKMQGVISQAGKVRPLHEVKALTVKGYPLTKKDFAKIKLNDVSFFLNFSPAPPKLKTPKLTQQDPTFLKIWTLSIFLTVFIFGGMGMMKVNPVIEVEQLPPRIATIIYESNAKQEPKASEKQGAGARAKGQAGTSGKPNTKLIAIPQTKALRPGQGKQNAVSTHKGHAQTQGLGVVDVFKSNPGALSKLLAASSGVSRATKNLEGYSGFTTTRGAGGLGTAGSQAGGGGQAIGLGGLSTSGSGSGNILGGLGKINIEDKGATEPVVLGNIDRNAIAREIEKHRDEFKYCYEKEINIATPTLAGRVGVQFVIGASGAVTNAGISSSSLHNANTEKCVIEVIKRIMFLPIPGGGIAEVKYPFVFKPSTK